MSRGSPEAWPGTSMNPSAAIAGHADRHPERLALSMDGERRTYAALHERVRQLAGALADAGVERGTVVGVLLHNCLEFMELLGATAHLGGIFMPLNWRLAPAEIVYVCNHAGVEVIVSEPELAELLDEFAATSKVTNWLTLGAEEGRWSSLESAAQAADPVELAAAVEGDDVHRLMYTSGTTARPKGVMITYANLHWKCVAHVAALGLDGEDRGLACGPLYHVGALDLTTTNMLHVGASTHILRRFDAAATIAAIEEQRSTTVWLAPAMVILLLNSGEAAGRDLDSMRVIVDGGEKMPLPLIERVLEMFPRGWFADAYGLTETVSGDTFLDKGNTIEKLGSVGTPVPHTEIGVVDGDDQAVAAGEVGEVVTRGLKVCKGYWRDPEATAAAIRDGWLHTGDLGYLDEDGYLFIVDRLKDMIISGGENVASLEVERVVYEHPDVVEAAVVGSPHPRWNEVPVAYVVVREGTTPDAESLDELCRRRLASYKTPKAFRFIEALPRNPSGKVLKRDLREREAAAEGFAGEG